MKDFKVGVIGATGMVGQRFVTLLAHHPWFHLEVLAASANSAGKTYEEAVAGRWVMKEPMPEQTRSMHVYDATADMDEICAQVDFVFCAVNMPKDQIRALEEAYARREIPVISNNSAHRMTPDVPMIIPELNPQHAEIIPAQRRRLGTRRGFITVKSNCSLQSYVPPLTPLIERFGLNKVLACTYQAISGASKTFERWPEMVDNLIPYIPGEEEKSEQEPLKIWGRVEGDRIVHVSKPSVTTQCLRVPISDGHTAAVFASFDTKPDLEEIKRIWNEYSSEAQELNLPSAPRKFLNYFEENDQPQIKTARELEHGMAISIGRLRPDTQYDIKFVCMSHNTLLGAAGGAVETAEYLAAKGYLD
ncbi:MAG: aspartate-semialdehyde dehydrogenase [Firmicutes bacterium]|nr:aspartate-semialdehyde dehydrogenase [Bacillota bacterium]